MDLGFDFRYYLSLLRRRFLYIFIPFVLVFGVSAAIAILLPPVYRSTGKILVESQQIPADLVRSTITSYADERIEMIKQRVMTRKNLFRIVDKFDLFSGKKQEMTSTEIIDEMQDAISVAPVDPGIKGLRRRVGATIAFAVSFEHQHPDTAMRVANELVTLFLDENTRARTSRAAETTKFLEQESVKLVKQVEAIENRIAIYKQQNGQSLPEHLELRVSMLERAQSALKETNREIKALEAERRFLDIQLDAVKAGFGVDGVFKKDGTERLTPAEELKHLQMELFEKSAVYNAAHPDVITLKRRIGGLRQRATSRVARKDLENRINALKVRRKETRSRFADGHPDVKNLTKEIENIRRQLTSLAPETETASSEKQTIDPVRANVLAKIEVANSRVVSLSKQRRALKQKVADLEAMIVQTPQVERVMKSLSRDYQNAISKYEEVKGKAMEAKLGQHLEEDKKAERFSLLEPPIHPDSPVKPNRHKFIALGLALAVAAGAGGLFLIESVDGSIRGTAGYIAMLKQRPLISIPYIATASELRRRRWVYLGIVFLAVMIIIVGLLALHFYYKPLDVLWFKFLNRLQ